jgi:hypothetical protein
MVAPAWSLSSQVAQYGAPRLRWFSSVLADIGDGQSLQQSLSTFGGHVRRLRQVGVVVCLWGHGVCGCMSASSLCQVKTGVPYGFLVWAWLSIAYHL